MGKVLDLYTDIQVGRKSLPMTNALAYFAMTKVKLFYVNVDSRFERRPLAHRRSARRWRQWRRDDQRHSRWRVFDRDDWAKWAGFNVKNSFFFITEIEIEKANVLFGKLLLIFIYVCEKDKSLPE